MEKSFLLRRAWQSVQQEKQLNKNSKVKKEYGRAWQSVHHLYEKLYGKPEAHIKGFHMLFPHAVADQLGDRTYSRNSTCLQKIYAASHAHKEVTTIVREE